MAKGIYINTENSGVKKAKKLWVNTGNGVKKVKKAWVCVSTDPLQVNLVYVAGYKYGDRVAGNIQDNILQDKTYKGSSTLPAIDDNGLVANFSASNYSSESIRTGTQPFYLYSSVGKNVLTSIEVSQSSNTYYAEPSYWTGQGYSNETYDAASSSSEVYITGYRNYRIANSGDRFEVYNFYDNTLTQLDAGIYLYKTSNDNKTVHRYSYDKIGYTNGTDDTIESRYTESGSSYYGYGTITIQSGSDGTIYTSMSRRESPGGGKYYVLSGDTGWSSCTFHSDDEESQGPIYCLNAGTASQATGVTKYWAVWDGSGLTTYSESFGVEIILVPGSSGYFTVKETEDIKTLQQVKYNKVQQFTQEIIEGD